VALAFSGPGLPVYVAAWVIMPKAPLGTPYDPARRGPVLGGGTTPIAGAALLFAAVLIVFDNGLFHRDVLLPALLIGGGVWLLVRDREDGVAPAGTPGGAPTAGGVSPATPPWAPGAGSWQGAGGVPPSQAVSPWAADVTTEVPLAAPGAPGGPPGQPAGGAWSGRHGRERPSSVLGQVVLGALLLAAAGLWALAAADVVEPDVSDVLGLGILGIGVGLVVGAWFGRARWLIAPGLLLVAALSVAGAVDVPLEGGFGERRFEPLALAELRDEYRLVAGEMVLDLRSLDLPAERVVVEASIGAGSLVVVLPPDATAVVDAEIGAGELSLPGDLDDGHRGGVGVDQRVTLPGDEGAGTLVLDLEVGLGEVQVSRG
jgi:hypothetical protein